MNEFSREQLETMINTLTDVCLTLADAQTVEDMLIANGFTDKQLKAIGFDVEV